MKIVINPQFEFLQYFVASVPYIFPHAGKTLYQSRNELKTFKVGKLEINVKKYKIPHLLNRIVYSFFRLTKTERAYRYALHLLSKGISTPAPVAYIEKWHGGLFSEGYFISLQSHYTQDFRSFWRGKVTGNEDVLRAFAAFTARLHENKIFHQDYSPGNILYEVKPLGVSFSLVDLNRMKFGRVDENLGCHSFERLFDSEEILRFVAAVYAEKRGFDAKRCQAKVIAYHNRCMKYFKIKNTLKHPLLVLTKLLPNHHIKT